MASGSTPTYNIPYPLSTDTVNVHGDMQELAEQVDSTLQTLAGPSAFFGRYVQIFEPASGTYQPNNLMPANTWVTSTGVARTQILYLPTAKSIDRIGIEVTTQAGTGGVLRLGIYNADPATGLPSTLSLDAGTVSSTTTGVKEITISKSLSAGLYYLVAVAQTSGCTVRSEANFTYNLTSNVTSFPSGGIAASATYEITGVTGALPSTFSNPTFTSTTPRIKVRIV